MALIVKTNTFSAGDTIIASEHNDNFDTIYNEFNGNIDNANIKAAAAIADSKLAQITTASKVSGAALTSLANIPAAAGVIPATNTNLSSVLNSQTGISITGTTLMVLDDSIPQITEGDQYMALAITPTNADNKLLIQTVSLVSHSVNETAMIVALFQNATANALAVVSSTIDNATGQLAIPLNYYMVAGTTDTITFKTRIGGNKSGTTTFNGVGEARMFGGIATSSMTVTEIK